LVEKKGGRIQCAPDIVVEFVDQVPCGTHTLHVLQHVINMLNV